MMKTKLPSAHKLSCLLTVALFLSVAAVGNDDNPWALRDHYATKSGNATFYYGRDNGEWGVILDSKQTLVDHVRVSAVLDDGTVVDLSASGAPEVESDTLETPLGDARFMEMVFPPNRGLSLVHRVEVYKERPFLVVVVTAKNASKKPIRIARLDPMTQTNNFLKDVDEPILHERHPVSRLRAFPIYDGDGASNLSHFELAKHEMAFGVGVIDVGRGASSVDTVQSGPAWTAGVSTRFDPPIDLVPGDTARAGVIWVSYATKKAEEIDEFFTWTQSIIAGPKYCAPAPKIWVTAPPGATAAALLKSADAWRDSGATHLVVPRGWDEFVYARNVTPAYPKDLEQFVKAANGKSMTAGITLDVLKTTERECNWIAEDDAGRRWINPKHPDGQESIHASVRELMNDGFAFFVLDPTAMPVETLAQFNVTRNEANALALDIVIQAGDGLPVVPAAAEELPPDSAAWTAAIRSTQFNEAYGLVASPIAVRLDNGTLPDALQTAVSAYGGSIALYGEPGTRARRQLRDTIDAWYRTQAGD